MLFKAIMNERINVLKGIFLNIVYKVRSEIFSLENFKYLYNSFPDNTCFLKIAW